MKRILAASMALTVLLCLFSVDQAVAKTYKLRLQCVYPERAYAGQSTVFFAKRVKELTRGGVEIKIFWPGQLAKAKEAFDAMQKGMIDAYSGSLLYFAGFIPEVNCEWLPFGWQDPQQAVEVYKDHGWLDLMRQAARKHGAHYVAPICVASMGLITKFPVKKIEDLRGRKIRAVGMEAKIVSALGASPVAIAGAEQYMALKLGVVEGTDYPFYTIGKYKFYEVCSYIVRPALHTPGIIEILVNERVYKSLPREYQEAINKAGWETFERTAGLSPTWDQKAYQTCRDRNVSIIDLAPAELERFRVATLPLWDQMATKTEIAGKMVSSLKAYLGKKGVKMH